MCATFYLQLNFLFIQFAIDNFQEWNSDKLPVYEPGLDDVIRECRGRNLVSALDFITLS